MAASFTHHRFTADEYERMGEVGILHEDDRVELIDGEIVQMAAIGAKHFRCVNRLNRLLVLALGTTASVSVQNPVRLSDITMPQPDLAVLHGQDVDDTVALPEDVYLVIEVSDSTLASDRSTKLPSYARAGIAEAWIVDLKAGRIERHTDPGTTGYRLIAILERGDTLASTVLPAIAISVDVVLGKL